MMGVETNLIALRHFLTFNIVEFTLYTFDKVIVEVLDDDRDRGIPTSSKDSSDNISVRNTKTLPSYLPMEKSNQSTYY